ncbi:MAG: hypothetical protein KDD55_00340 [Bdellovibrionales bacterium]|nr:hypothetical protein [Bdellovibrionales bacterium]
MQHSEHTPDYRYLDGNRGLFGSAHRNRTPEPQEVQEVGAAIAQLPQFSHVQSIDEFPRVRIYSVPERSNHFNSALYNRIAEVEVTPLILGQLAFQRWSNIASSQFCEVVGETILKAIARSEEQFWELPVILTEYPLGGGAAPIVEAYLGVSSPSDNDFSDGKLTLLFTYHSEDDPLNHTIVAHWVEQISQYTTLRGLPESLMALCGDERTLEELVGAPPLQFPLPPNFNRANHIQSLIPETLTIGEKIHQRHPQVSCGLHSTDIRIPTNIESPDALRYILETTQVAQALRREGFSVSLCEGVAPLFQDPRADESSDEARSLADLLPSPEQLAAFERGEMGSDAPGFWGSYLHFRCEHDDTPEARLEALSGMLVLIYNFRDHISGLRPLREELSTPAEHFLSLKTPGASVDPELIAATERLTLHLNDSPLTNEAHRDILQLAAYLDSSQNLLLPDRLCLLAGVNNSIQLRHVESREMLLQLQDVIDGECSLNDYARISLSFHEARPRDFDQEPSPPTRPAAAALYETMTELAIQEAFGPLERSEAVGNSLYHSLRHLSGGQIKFLGECLSAIKEGTYTGEEMKMPLLYFLDSVDRSLSQ